MSLRRLFARARLRGRASRPRVPNKRSKRRASDRATSTVSYPLICITSFSNLTYNQLFIALPYLPNAMHCYLVHPPVLTFL
uniref:Uncharacterized protein n=1 Tax=Pararge aegeria TaxID=116150 RepID=S4P3A6_9NEOP